MCCVVCEVNMLQYNYRFPRYGATTLPGPNVFSNFNGDLLNALRIQFLLRGSEYCCADPDIYVTDPILFVCHANGNSYHPV